MKTTNYSRMDIKQPNVLFSPEAWAKIQFWVRQSPVEISGLGKCKFVNGNWHVLSVYLLEQENTATETELDPQAITKLMYEAREDEGHLNFWWHSHADMGVFWSSTDDAALAQIGGQGFCLASVFNKKGESRHAYYQGANGFVGAVFLDELKHGMIQQPYDTSSWEAEYKAKCKKKVYAPSKQWNGANNYTGKGSHRSKGGGTSVVGKSEDTTKSILEVGNTKTSKNTTKASSETTADYFAESHGMINPLDMDQRWDSTTRKWVKFSEWIDANAQWWGESVIDHERLEWCEKYFNEMGYPPEDDDDVDVYAREKLGITFDEFYPVQD